jgi:hypothetical protein
MFLTRWTKRFPIEEHSRREYTLRSASQPQSSTTPRRRCPRMPTRMGHLVQRTRLLLARATMPAIRRAIRASQQGVEHSAILPTAGGTDESAAPTVKKDGQEVNATECSKPPNLMPPASGTEIRILPSFLRGRAGWSSPSLSSGISAPINLQGAPREEESPDLV